MSIKSMTGFGRATLLTNDFDIAVEVKSVNSKYLDPVFKIPKILSIYEIVFRKLLQEKIYRGKVELKIDVLLKTTGKIPKINLELLHQYKNILHKIREETNVHEDITLEHYLRMPDLIDFISDENLEKTIENASLQVVKDALDNLNIMRLKEGEELEKDITARLIKLGDILKEIEASKVDVFAHWHEKFKNRLAQFDISENSDRMVQEAIIYSEKADITEEVTRAKSHIEQYKQIIKNDAEVGKKLDFLSIELTREFNTIASKSSSCAIINSVVSAKAEVDRIREQVQNLL